MMLVDQLALASSVTLVLVPLGAADAPAAMLELPPEIVGPPFVFDAGRIVGDGVVVLDVEEVFVNVPLAEFAEDAEPRFVAPAFPRLAPPLLLSL